MKYFVREVPYSADAPAWGTVAFDAHPRKGEFLTRNNESGVGQAYRILGVVYGVDPSLNAERADLYVKHIGSVVDLEGPLLDGLDYLDLDNE